jgi:hypothetical protein
MRITNEALSSAAIVEKNKSFHEKRIKNCCEKALS